MKTPAPRPWCRVNTKQHPEAHRDEAMRLVALLLCVSLFLPCWAQHSVAAETGNSGLVATSIRNLSDKSASVRTNAAINLHNLGAKASSAAPKLISMLATERDPEVRKYVVDAIGAAAGQLPEAVPPLIRVLEHDRDEGVRSSAAASLGRIGLLPELSAPALVAALRDEAERVRAEAAKSLGAEAFAAAAQVIVPALVTALTDKTSSVQQSAGRSLSELGPKAIAALPALRTLLVDPDSSKRNLAANILASIGPQASAAAPECFAALSDQNIEVRVEAAIALLAFGQHVAPAMELLVNALSFDDDRSATKYLRKAVRVRAAWAIGAYAQYAPGTAAPSLAIDMRDPNEDVRRFATQAFDKILVALVKGHRVDAIASLKETRTILQASADGDQKMKAVAVGNAIAALEKEASSSAGNAGESAKTPGAPVAQHGSLGTAVAMGTIALACFFGAAVLRKRGSGLASRRTVRVFLSYRRQDSASFCGRVYDRLIAHFGAANVFRDIDSLAPGDSFAEKIREYISQCDAVIVLIGTQWLSIADAAGRRRLDDPGDFVRMEIVEAAVQEKLVVPALHDGAPMPGPQDLPLEIAFLAQRNAIELTDRHFASDMKQLVDALSKASSGSRDAGREVPVLVSGKVRSWWLTSVAGQLPASLLALGLLFTLGALWIAYLHLNR